MMNDQFDNTKEKWTELHESLQDLLAGYADNELDEQDTLIIEAHLSGCENCRNDLARQNALSERLEIIPPARITSGLQKRIDNMQLEESPVPDMHLETSLAKVLIPFKSWFKNISRQPVFGASGWAFALIFAVVISLPTSWQTQRSQIPMINDALAEYHKMNSIAFPVSNKNTSIKAPVNLPEGRTLATWATSIAGEPAQAFAIRSGRNIIFQYQINETVLFRNPEVRQAIADFGNYKLRSNEVDVLALPLTDSGVLVVGPAKSLPAVEKIEF